jgi:hypothetical protein
MFVSPERGPVEMFWLYGPGKIVPGAVIAADKTEPAVTSMVIVPVRPQELQGGDPGPGGPPGARVAVTSKVVMMSIACAG